MIAEFEQFGAIVDRASTFVLTTHVNPDGDGLGCELAIAAYLRAKGKRVSILNHSATPPNYLFLDPANDIQRYDPSRHESLIAEADVIVVLDSNHPDRLVSMQQAVLSSRATKVCIDHHLDTAPFADLYIIDEPATATGEIVFKLIAYLDGTALDKSVCATLYAAIMTDTGGFRYPKTDSEVHRIVAQLIDHGADPVEIYNQIFDQGSPNRLQLLGKVLAGLTLAHDGKLAYISVTREMLSQTSTTEIDTDSFIPYTLGIQGVQIGLMFTELAGGVKISFRSKGEIWINQLAKQFSGNGHKNAAGGRVMNSGINEVIPQVLQQAKTFLREEL